MHVAQVVQAHQCMTGERGHVGIAAGAGALEGRLQLVVVGGVAREPSGIAKLPVRLLDLRRQLGHRAAMALVGERRIAVARELLGTEQAHRLEQTIARWIGAIDLHHRLVDQRRQRVEHDPFVGAAIGEQTLRRLEAKAADEHREPAQHRLRARVEQRMAPFERRAQCLVARERIARGVAQELQPLADAHDQRFDAEQRDARGRHLDRERNAVQMAQQRDHGRPLRRHELETPVDRLGALLEQPPGAAAARIVEARIGRRHRQRVEPVGELPRAFEQLLRRHEPVHAGRTLLRRRGQARDRIDEVLAVVKHQQQRACFERAQQWLERIGAVAAELQAGGVGDGRGKLRRLRQRRQVDPPDAVGMLPALVQRHFVRNAGLADAAGAEHAWRARPGRWPPDRARGRRPALRRSDNPAPARWR